ncbi:metallophosphoesterase, DNA ligase-associated [Candidatus Rubidus massiliensis]|nr:MAG: hypothetical protein BGO10_10515 [Chlamydia sp. 32-24]CDZ79985.1 metallophosphoesterase, DNA ligase-associated [Candidatus Rubidus massiliensis]
MEITIEKQTLDLLPEKGIFWHEQKILIVADIHIGKAATFHHYGIPVPEGSMEDDLKNLSSLINCYQPQACIVVGDLIHSKEGLTPPLISYISEWLESVNSSIHLVFGNHDRALIKKLPDNWNLQCHYQELIIPPFRFCHIPNIHSVFFTWSGHLHPTFSFSGKGDKLRLPCFYLSELQGILPAFSSFVGGYDMKKKKNDQIFVTTGKKVIKIF